MTVTSATQTPARLPVWGEYPTMRVVILPLIVYLADFVLPEPDRVILHQIYRRGEAIE